MRRLLAAVAVAAAVAVVPATAHAGYSRACGRIVDTECSGWVCPTDCWQRDCFLWVDLQHNAMTAQCVRPLAPVNG